MINYLIHKLCINLNKSYYTIENNFTVARVESNGLFFSGNTPVDIQLVTFLSLLSSVSELNIGEKTKKCDNHYHL